MARLPEVPSWFYLGAVATGVAVAIVFLLSRERTVVKVPATDSAMRPAIGEGTDFEVDPSWLANPTRDAVVAYVPPGRSEAPSVARVVAVAGDRLEVRMSKLYVNGKAGANTQRGMSTAEVPQFTCPRACVYVLVDKPSRGVRDSDNFGPLPVWRVLGSITP